MGCVQPVDKTAIREGKFREKALGFIKKFHELKGYVIETQTVIYLKFDITEKVMISQAKENKVKQQTQQFDEVSPFRQDPDSIEKSEDANNFEELANVVLKSGLNIDNNIKTLNQQTGDLLAVPKNRQADKDKNNSGKNNITIQENIVQRNNSQQPKPAENGKPQENTSSIHSNNQGGKLKKSKFLQQEDIIILGNKNENAPSSNKTTQANIQAIEDHSQDGKQQGQQQQQQLIVPSNADMVNIDSLKFISAKVEWDALRYAYARYTARHKTTTVITDLCRQFLETIEAQLSALEELYKQADILDKCVKAYKMDMENTPKNAVFDNLLVLMTNCKKMQDQMTISKTNLTSLSLMTIVTNTSNSLLGSTIPKDHTPASPPQK